MLLNLKLHRQFGNYKVGQDTRTVNGLQAFRNFITVFNAFQPFFKALVHNAPQRFLFHRVAHEFGNFFNSDFQVCGPFRKAVNDGTIQSVYKNTNPAAGHTKHLLNFDQSADVINAVYAGIFFTFIYLCGHHQKAIGIHSLFNGFHRTFSPDIDMTYQFRKYDNPSKRDEGYGYDIAFFHFFHLLFRKSSLEKENSFPWQKMSSVTTNPMISILAEEPCRQQHFL